MTDASSHLTIEDGALSLPSATADESARSCHVRGVEWANRPENKAQAVGMIVKYAKASPGDAEKTYDYFAKLEFFNSQAYLTDAIFDKMKVGLLQMGDVREPVPPLSRFFDASYLTDAEKLLKAK